MSQSSCPSCGSALGTVDRFCPHCGVSLEVNDTGVLPVIDDATGELPAVDDPVAGLPAGDAVLLVRRGQDAGARFMLAGGEGTVITAGRMDESSIFLDDVTVSRRHAEFRRSARGWELVDIGSLNGTYVNKDRIDTVSLRDGDEVQIGKYRFLLRISEGS